MRRLLVVTLAAVALAPTAAAAHARFSVRVEGAVELNWRDQATYSSGGCAITDTVTGTQRIEFRSARASVVSLPVRRGRVRFSKPVTLSSLVGRVSGGGQDATQTCEQDRIADFDCAASALTGGSVALSADSSGRLGLSQLQADGLQAGAACLPQALRSPDYPPLARARTGVDPRRLLRRRTTVLKATDKGVVHIATDSAGGLGESGFLARQVAWKLVFHRLPR